VLHDEVGTTVLLAGDGTALSRLRERLVESWSRTENPDRPAGRLTPWSLPLSKTAPRPLKP
jgi:hypothetical protein